MLSGFQRRMRRSIPLLGDMEPRQCLRRTHIITRSTHPTKQLSERVMSTQKCSHRPCSRIATQPRSSPRRRQSSSKNMLQTRLTWMDQDKPCSIIARAMWWTLPSGTAQAGPPKRIRTLTRIELNTENSSTSQNHSTTESWGRVRARCATRTWPTSQETWGSRASAARTWITADSRRQAEDWKMASRSTSTQAKNEVEISSSKNSLRNERMHAERSSWLFWWHLVVFSGYLLRQKWA